MKKLTLVILAVGMGGCLGLKQLDTMNKEDDTIIDFSINDAIEAGFSKIVFIVRKSFKDNFKQLFTKKLSGKIALAFVCQEVDSIPIEFLILI